MKPLWTLQEAKERQICRLCGRPPADHLTKDKFVLEYGREFAHDHCLRKYERYLKRQIPDRDTYGHG